MGSGEIFPVEGSELDGFRDMRALDLIASVKVSDGSCHTEDSVIAARGQTQTVKGFSDDIPCSGVELAVFSDLCGGERRIAVESLFSLISFLRKGTRVPDPFKDLGGGFRIGIDLIGGDFLIRE